MIDFGIRPVQFDDQQRFDIERVACMHEVFSRVDREFVHHFHAARNDARADDRGDASARGVA